MDTGSNFVTILRIPTTTQCMLRCNYRSTIVCDLCYCDSYHCTFVAGGWDMISTITVTLCFPGWAVIGDWPRNFRSNVLSSIAKQYKNIIYSYTQPLKSRHCLAHRDLTFLVNICSVLCIMVNVLMLSLHLSNCKSGRVEG